MNKLSIGKYQIGGERSFLIAEIGNNHNGDYKKAIQMIDEAKSIGADCVKFQIRKLDEVYRERSLKKKGEDLGTEYIIDLLDRFELSLQEHKKLANYCKKKEILYLSTPWDVKSIEFLEKIGVEAYKVASADLTNIYLIARLVKTRKPLILSTGMSSEGEIRNTVNYLNKHKAKFVLLHCNSTYPAPYQDINLLWMKKLKKIHPFVGYSGHERGIAVSLAARAMGACVIERHFTLDRLMEGPDHSASLERKEFKELIQGVRQIEQAFGEGTKRIISQGEMINRENLAKSLVSSMKIKEGTAIKAKHVKIRSPGQGLSPQYYEELIGKKLNRDMEKEDFFYPSDLTLKSIKPKKYSFNRPWGIPVRFHDIKEYENLVKPDLFEFHLSYSDMDLNISDYLTKNKVTDFVVHAPELFSKSMLMDLASPDESYRNESIKETQRVIDITIKLKEFFPKTERPLIVANIGGFSMDEPLKEIEIESYYERFAESLNILNLKGVELIPQNMAPFPWHFGGQRYQNLFVFPEEIIDWCKKLDLRICLDISHAALTCNHFGLDLYEFTEKLGSLVAHLHLGDASGVNGEGLQINDGEIDFKKLSDILFHNCPKASFIPEIWQGHKNRGEGFWVALDRLQKNF